MPGPPRRRPYPADIVIDGRGYMLGKLNKQAALISTRVPGLDNVTPSDYSYSSESPTEGRIASWDSLILGYGLMRQETANDQRARHCINADTSAGVWQKGPYIATYTPSTKDTTNGIANFFEIEVSNVATLFALNGRYCHMRTSDLDWDTSRKDFGASYAATDVEVFYSNVSGGVKYAYVAMGDSWPIYRF
ncbi:MAG: hypothetical protein QG671_3492, partial [Actinomycetota bacterium]|nr:hypothetical protein [Actinomycetota bacterium]